MLRRVLVLSSLLVAAAACGGKPKDTGPAWPKSAGWQTPESWEEDGGESLEPRVAGDATAMEHSDDAPTLDELLDVEIPTDEPTPEPPPEEPKVDDTFVPEETIIIIEGEPAP